MLTRAHVEALRSQLLALAGEAVTYGNTFEVERTWLSIEARGEGGSHTSKGQRPDVYLVHLQTVMNADRYAAFGALFDVSQKIAQSDALFTDAQGKSVPTERRRKFLSDHLAAPFIARYVHRSPYPLDLSEDRVDLAMAALGDALEAREHRYVEVRPLLNVVLTADDIPLGQDVRLRRVSGRPSLATLIGLTLERDLDEAETTPPVPLADPVG